MGDQIPDYRRVHGNDYPRGASLFITLATEPRAAPLFGRGACLTLNDEIAAMAMAGEGGALYWRDDGQYFTPKWGAKG